VASKCNSQENTDTSGQDATANPVQADVRVPPETKQLWLDGSTLVVRIGHLISDSVDPCVHGVERTQHVIKTSGSPASARLYAPNDQVRWALRLLIRTALREDHQSRVR
jgi:hypothetical protein